MNSYEKKIKDWYERLDSAANMSLEPAVTAIWIVIEEMESFVNESEKYDAVLTPVGGDTGIDADANVTVITDPDEFADFLEEHVNEIDGLFRDKYFRNGGWNGLMDALSEVEKRYNVVVEMDDWEDGKFEEIIKEFF